MLNEDEFWGKMTEEKIRKLIKNPWEWVKSYKFSKNNEVKGSFFCPWCGKIIQWEKECEKG